MAHGLLDLTSTPFESYPGISLWYLPFGLLLAVWLLYGVRFAPFVFAAIVLVDGLRGYPLNAHVTLLSVLTFAVTVGPLSRVLRFDPRLSRLRDVLHLGWIAALVALIYAVVTVSALVAVGSYAPADLRTVALAWWVGDMVGAAVLTPFVLVWLAPIARGEVTRREGWGRVRAWCSRHGGEALAQLLSLPLTVWLVFASPPLRAWDLYYLCFLPVVWIALRHGLPGATLAVFANSVLISGAVWLTGYRVPNITQLQLLVVALSLTGLILGFQQTARVRARVEREVLHAALHAARLEIIERLTAALDWRDGHTGEHTFRVSSLSGAVARQLGLGGLLVERLALAALLHDLGKIGIPDAVLHKPGRLTPEEWALMQRHTLIGGDLLGGSPAPVVRLAEQIALTHHERWDGAGYLSGLRGEAIPLAGRIVAVADSFDAMLSDRPYRPAWSQEEALREILASSGTQFDPAVVEAFVAALEQPVPTPVTLSADPLPQISLASRRT